MRIRARMIVCPDYLAMDSVTSSSDEKYNFHAGLVSNSQPPQLPPNSFLQPNSQLMSDDPIARFLQPIPRVQSHPMVNAESNPLIIPHSASLSNKTLQASDPGCLDAVMGMPSARPLHFTGGSMNGSAGLLPNATPLPMEDPRQGSADCFSTAISIMGNKAPGRTRKKRRRASRRAPTKVVVTDTTNFRAMVQELTGIPATSLVPPHLHWSGISFPGQSKLGFGDKLEPQLTTCGGLLGPFSPEAKLATSVGQQSTLCADFGLFNFQSSDTYSILQRGGAGGECTDNPVNHSARTADLHADQAVLNDANVGT